MEHFYQHLAKGHWLARVDARIKLLVTLALLVMVISYQGFLFPLLVCGLCLAFWFQMRIPLRTVLMRFSEPLFIIAVLLILKTFFTGHAPLFTITCLGQKIIGYRDGLLQGLMIGSRIGAAVSLVALLGFATPFTEFLAGLSWLRIPRGFIEIVLFAYRYIFVLIEDALVIYQAQKNRLGYSNVRRGLNSFGVLAGSLTLKGFEQSQNTAQAMVQRGYDGTLPYLRHRAFQPLEIVGSLSFLLIMGMVWAY
jgi:cobalt/nickel transport system permease protein